MGGWSLNYPIFLSLQVPYRFLSGIRQFYFLFWLDFMFDWMDFCSFLSFVICKFSKNLVFLGVSKWHMIIDFQNGIYFIKPRIPMKWWRCWRVCLVKVEYWGWPQASYWWESPHSGFVQILFFPFCCWTNKYIYTPSKITCFIFPFTRI